MTFLPLYRDKKHKFKNGYWTWNENASKLKFHSHDESEEKKEKVTDKRRKNSFELNNDDVGYASDVGLRFVNHIDEADEKLFLENFQRPNSFYDSNVITLQDIKNLALFTLEARITNDFIEFLHTTHFDRLLHAVIFYFDLYLLVLEFLLIRRDKLIEDEMIRDAYSIKVEKSLSKRLDDRRLLLAREYSNILLNKNEDGVMTIKNLHKKKRSVEKNLIFYEMLIDFTAQCTFIALHRRSFNAISCELNRLFRTEFFNIAKHLKRCQYEFNLREKQILFGQKCYENSFRDHRQQHSPLIAEILNLSSHAAQVLKIGREKYIGSNKYLFNLELEFTIPECHLCLIGKRRGILGHPKCLYDTMLNLNENAVRKTNFSKDYDLYGLIRPAFIDTEVFTHDVLKRQNNLSTRLIIHREAYGGTETQLKVWKQKELIMKRNLTKSIVE